nr:hypothetical protein [Desulfospira joergensenii]
MVEKPGDWKWSSFHATASKGSIPNWLTTDWILGQFAQNRKAARKSYLKFVESGISEKTSPWDRLKGQIFFGSKGFIQSIKSKNEDIKEVPKVQRYATRIRLENLFRDIKNKQHRNEKVWMAYARYGYTMKEIADYLSIHYTTVSKIINQRKK